MTYVKYSVRVDDVAAGETLEVSWPVPEFEQHIEVGGRAGAQHPYTFRWRGNTVTGVEPPGRISPLFVPGSVSRAMFVDGASAMSTSRPSPEPGPPSSLSGNIISTRG